MCDSPLVHNRERLQNLFARWLLVRTVILLSLVPGSLYSTFLFIVGACLLLATKFFTDLKRPEIKALIEVTLPCLQWSLVMAVF